MQLDKHKSKKMAKRQNKNKLNFMKGRRKFLTGSIYSVPLLAALSPSKLFGSTLDISTPKINDFTTTGTLFYICESGIFGIHNKFVLGVLIVSDDILKSKLAVTRSKTNYRTKFSYNSTDKFKYDYGVNAINSFINSSCKFMAMIVDKSEYSNLQRQPNGNVSKRQIQIKKIDLYKELLSSTLIPVPRGSIYNVIVKSQSSFGPREIFQQNFQQETGKTYVPINVVEDDVLQLTDFLTGNLFAEHWTRNSTQSKGTVKNKTKQNLYKILKDRLGVLNLIDGLNGKFEVIFK